MNGSILCLPVPAMLSFKGSCFRVNRLLNFRAGFECVTVASNHFKNALHSPCFRPGNWFRQGVAAQAEIGSRMVVRAIAHSA